MYGKGMAEFEVTQSGSTLSLSVGDEIVVRVPEMPTSGYAWTVNAVDPVLRLVESTFVAPAGNGSEAAPGAGGQRVIRLRAAAAGAAGAELALKRPWEAEPTETFTVHATVA
jgi:predicted secreted protein